MLNFRIFLKNFRVILILNFLFINNFILIYGQDFQFENNERNKRDENESRKKTEKISSFIMPEFDPSDGDHYKYYEKQVSKCSPDENKIFLTLILRSHQWNEINEEKKNNAINKLSKFFLIPKNFISLTDVSRKEIHEMTENVLRYRLVGLDNENNHNFGTLQFMIGCGGFLFNGGQMLLISNQIGDQMANGVINNFSGLDFGYFVVWSNENKIARSKRQIGEGSGEIKYHNTYDDDDEDDEEDYEEITEVPSDTNFNKQKHRHHHGETDDYPYQVSTENVPSTSERGYPEFHEPKTRTYDFNYPRGGYPTSKPHHISTTTTEETILPIVIDTVSEPTQDADYNYDDDDDDEYEDNISTLPVTTTERAFSPVILYNPSTTTTTTTTMIPTTTSTTEASTTTTATSTSTESSTSTTTPLITTTEIIEIDEPINTNPIIRTRMPKQPLTAGKPFSLKIPLDIFYDDEDGTNLRLELLDKFNGQLKQSSWIQFDRDTREIYGLPLEDSVSKWVFHLKATDSGDKSVMETLDLVVQQHKTHRSDNHEIHIGVRLLQKFKYNVDWQIRLIRGIAETLGETTIANIVVREIRTGHVDPNSATFIYTNETLPKDRCPDNMLNELIKKLNVNDLNDSLSPEIEVKFVEGEMINSCKKVTHIIPETHHPSPKRYPPMPRNAVDFVNATAGQLLVFRVPPDTFFDPDDQPLKLSLLTSERTPLNPKHWLQFDSKNQEFYGIPKNYDIGQREYLLVAENLVGLTANDALIVIVTPAPKRDYSTMFETILGIPFENFNNSALQRRFIEKIAKIFEDPTTTNIQIRSIRPHYSYTLVSYYNTTLYKIGNRCPHDEIEILRNILLYPDGSIRDRAKDVLGTEFNLLNISLVAFGTCQNHDVIHPDLIIPRTEEPPASKLKDDYLLTFVLPAVIIIAMLLLASIIACYLHRRHLTGKMELGDEEERRSFKSKGIPVIFQDELEEKPEIGNKSPIILKDEKPPLLPPSYTSNNPDDNDDVDDYVPPPAVMMGGRESRGKSPVTPSYRKPPPYVSP